MRSAESERSRRPAIRLSVAVVIAIAFWLLLGSSSSYAAYTVESGITYANDSPSNPGLNQLDLYRPEVPESDLAPLVVYVHGGGWARGDKANSIGNKAGLFTGAGYFFASVNYRLSPDSDDADVLGPNRIRFPVHPQDVGRAIGWLSSNAVSRGIDPDRIILIGHSAGAHLVSLVSTDPSYLEDNGMDLRQILGTIVLDTASFDIKSRVEGDDADELNLTFINAFGTAEENAIDGAWTTASPLTWADSSDPEHLFITQVPQRRLVPNLAMATALGQGPETVVQVPLNHAGINAAVGNPSDASGTTPAINAFVAARLADFRPARLSVRKRPPRVVRTGWQKRGGKLRPKRRSVRFAFNARGSTAGFLCRLDRRPARVCDSPRRFRVGRGFHALKVWPLYPSGRKGEMKAITFIVKPKKRNVRR